MPGVYVFTSKLYASTGSDERDLAGRNPPPPKTFRVAVFSNDFLNGQILSNLTVAARMCWCALHCQNVFEFVSLSPNKKYVFLALLLFAGSVRQRRQLRERVRLTRNLHSQRVFRQGLLKRINPAPPQNHFKQLGIMRSFRTGQDVVM